MNCPHCTVVIHPDWNTGTIAPKTSKEMEHDDYFHGPYVETAWVWEATECPACNNAIINICLVDVEDPAEPLTQHLAYPRFPRRKPIGDAVPETLRADYIEASNTLPASAKASAALSRRILQAILNEQGYKSGTLSQQVDSALKENSPGKVLPSAIRGTIDAVRHLGNFAAHPITDKSRLQVIDVDSDEAKWCLEIIEALFEHFYSTPSVEGKNRLTNLHAKLAAAGKPSMLGKNNPVS